MKVLVFVFVTCVAFSTGYAVEFVFGGNTKVFVRVLCNVCN